jgi:hypothetical protein
MRQRHNLIEPEIVHQRSESFAQRLAVRRERRDPIKEQIAIGLHGSLM